jgi:hypothetical protein
MAIVYRLTKGTPLTNAEVDANFLHLDNVKTNRTLSLTAGNGLTGGGTLEANRTFTLGTPSTLTVSSTNSVTATSHNHALDLSGRSIITGDGLAGGGTLATNRTLQVDSSVVRTSRTITAGEGLSGGGNLSSNRTLNVDSSVVRTSRTITAGEGLSGGGNLSSNRTLNVDSSVVRTSGNQLISGNTTFRSLLGLKIDNSSGQDGILIRGRNGGTGDHMVSIIPTTLTGSRTLTLANGNTTLVPGTMASSIDAIVTLGGAFTGTNNLKCSKVGNVVTLTATGFSGHTNTSTPMSAPGVIPAAYRPAHTQTTTSVFYMGADGLAVVLVTGAGTLQIQHRNLSLALVNRTQTSSVFTISYAV